jgi:hypothetical protein
MLSDKRRPMKKPIFKVGLAMIVFILIFVFVLNPNLLKIAPKAGQNVLDMLQEFVKRDVVGIV